MDADTWDEKVFENKHDCINEWLRSKDSTEKSRRWVFTMTRQGNAATMLAFTVLTLLAIVAVAGVQRIGEASVIQWVLGVF